MTSSPASDPDFRQEALIRSGDHEALAARFQELSPAIVRWIDYRLDRRLRSRISPADVAQEVYLSAQHRLEHFRQLEEMPFGVWIRLLAAQRLIDIHRRHFGTEARDITREIALDAGGSSNPNAEACLVGPFTTPSRAAVRDESLELLQTALEELEPNDREVIRLRHFEGLSNLDVAARLGLTTTAATKRYIRALDRLRMALLRKGLIEPLS